MLSDLRTLLLAQSPITALVGAAGVFVGYADQATPLPYLTCDQTDSEEFNTLDGPSGSFRMLALEVDAKGRTRGEAQQLAETVRVFLKDYFGPAGTQVIDAVIVDGQFASVEPPISGSDQKTFVVTLELRLQYHPQ